MRHSLIVALRRLAQLISAILDVVRIVLLTPFLVIGLLFQPHIFDRSFYRSEPGPGRLRLKAPLLHFLLKGAWDLRAPHPGFSQEAMFRDYPRLRLRPPVLNHVLNPHGERDLPLRTNGVVDTSLVSKREEVVPDPAVPLVGFVQPVVQQRPDFEDTWRLFEADAGELSTEVSSVTPTQHVKKSLGANVSADASTSSQEMEVVLRLMRRLPDRVDHLFVVPWLGIKGGAERLSERYLAYLRGRYPGDRLCILVPDDIHSYSEGTESRYGVPIISINDEWPEADQATRVRIFDRILVNLRPKCVHNANSLIATIAFRKSAKNYSCDMKLFMNIFSDIRINDNEPIGYYHNYLPYLVDHVSGFICDNRNVAQKASIDFSLTEALSSKFFVVPTPLLGLNGGEPQLDLRPHRSKHSGRSLWMSRIAIEKRIDVLNAIARRLPKRGFSVYGATLAASAKVDLTLLELPNIDVKGEFEHLGRLPLADFDSYIFTSNNEGMPIAVLEATMLGLPVVAPNVGGIRELIDETTGWLVSSPDAVDEYVNALIEIEQYPEEAARRVARAQERLVERHSMQAFSEALEHIPGYLQLALQ